MSLTRCFRKFLEVRFRRAVLFLFCFYRTFLRSQMGHSCKFSPTCSHYVKDSFQTLGLAKGFFYSVKRIFKCHPFSRGGFDPVRERKRR